MPDPDVTSNLPAQIAEAVAGIPKALVPASLKAIDRLIGASVDIPVAWLAQKKAKIDAQTQAYVLMEQAIAKAASNEAGADAETIRNAVNVLVRKSYRAQVNREAVATAMVEDLRTDTVEGNEGAIPPTPADVDEDWLNVFERYAEDASTERMQNLWGRVLAGELRKPGRYSTRTLRFLSEFSQSDGLMFAELCKSVFAEMAPNALVKPERTSNIRDLVFLESSGLIQGVSGSGLAVTRKFDDNGRSFIREGDVVIVIEGAAGTTIKFPACVLTPLGQELLGLLPGRDGREAARIVANAIRTPEIESAFLGIIKDKSSELNQMEILWHKDVVQTTP